MIIGLNVRGGAGKANPNLTTGSMAKKKELKWASFDPTVPLDHTQALGNFKNNKSVFFGMLTKFRNTSLLTMINGVSIAQDAENWSKYKEMAQNIKRDSGYVGAGPLHYSAYFIQDAHSKNNRAEMASRYSRLVEDAI